jgi:hypothetical protein
MFPTFPAAAGNFWESWLIWLAIACEKNQPVPDRKARINSG